MDESVKELGTNLVGVIKAVAREVVTEREKPKECLDANYPGAKWSDEEDTILGEELEIAIQIMALRHKRNSGGIRARLEKLIKAHGL